MEAACNSRQRRRSRTIAFVRVGTLPTFELIVATIGRSSELARLFDSLARQTYRSFRVLLVDQNDDDSLDGISKGSEFEIRVLRSEPGLSRARNVALTSVSADVVAFPDDDAMYPDDLLERIAVRLAECPELEGLTGRIRDESGRVATNWSSTAGVVARDTVWYRSASSSLFLRSALVKRVGPFDESMGLGSGTPWSSGEEVDYLVRAVALGARIEFDPTFEIIHAVPTRRELHELGFRDGASVGYVLGKHAYPARAAVRMLVRSTGGVVAGLAGADVAEARFHAWTLWGRMVGIRAGRRQRARARGGAQC
jgi:glycosyltransferase involved in cell wall biosynthesis